MTLFERLMSRAAKRRAYRNTVFALDGVPHALREDLNIYPGDAEPLARAAVYGR